jgi:SEC-C motif domain protein
MRCPCRKKSETTRYAGCCQPYHLGTRVAATPEALMRSRYAAFALQQADYISATWHPSTRPNLFTFTAGQEWQSLLVRAVQSRGDDASVEFVARSRIGGTTYVLHEVSRFMREGGQWFYVDGVTT